MSWEGQCEQGRGGCQCTCEDREGSSQPIGGSVAAVACLSCDFLDTSQGLCQHKWVYGHIVGMPEVVLLWVSV